MSWTKKNLWQLNQPEDLWWPPAHWSISNMRRNPRTNDIPITLWGSMWWVCSSVSECRWSADAGIVFSALRSWWWWCSKNNEIKFEYHDNKNISKIKRPKYNTI